MHQIASKSEKYKKCQVWQNKSYEWETWFIHPSPCPPPSGKQNTK